MNETIKILVTDDDPNLLLVTTEVLRRAGYEARRRVRASPRCRVWRKPNPKLRGDEQQYDHLHVGTRV
jgi:DNA-binding response OmpR family regulator